MRRRLYSNRGLMVSEATALPTEPQPLVTSMNKFGLLFQGSHTLPRAGNRRTTSEKSSQDDSNVAGTTTVNRRGVRIRICGDEILSSDSFSNSNTFSNFDEDDEDVLTFNNNNKNLDPKVILENLKDPATNLNNFVEKKELNISPAFVVTPKAATKKSKTKRKYTLEELEVEGFEPSTSESERQSNIPEEFDDDVDDDVDDDDEVDLSSLIEGGVDDDDLVDDSDVNAEHMNREKNTTFPEMDASSSSATSRRPSRPQLTIVDDVEDDEEEEIFGEDQELVRLIVMITYYHFW